MSRKALIVRIPPIDKHVWSPSNPGGRVIAMLMLEDPAAGRP